MPKVTSHVCRQTFCSNMAKSAKLRKISIYKEFGIYDKSIIHLPRQNVAEEAENQYLQ